MVAIVPEGGLMIYQFYMFHVYLVQQALAPLYQPLVLVSVYSAFMRWTLRGIFLHQSRDRNGTKRTTAQNEQSTERYSQLTTLLQTAPSWPDSSDHVQDMSAESFGIQVP